MNVLFTSVYGVCGMVTGNIKGCASEYEDKAKCSRFFNAMIQRWLVEEGVSSRTAMQLAKHINAEMMKKCKTRASFFKMFYIFLTKMTTDIAYSNTVLSNVSLMKDIAARNIDKADKHPDISSYKQVEYTFLDIFGYIMTYDYYTCYNTYYKYCKEDISDKTMKDMCALLKVVLFKIVKYSRGNDEDFEQNFYTWLDKKLKLTQGTYVDSNDKEVEFANTKTMQDTLFDMYVLSLLMDNYKFSSTTNFDKFIDGISEDYIEYTTGSNFNVPERTKVFCKIVGEKISDELGYAK